MKRGGAKKKPAAKKAAPKKKAAKRSKPKAKPAPAAETSTFGSMLGSMNPFGGSSSDGNEGNKT